jgi:hypothetical protein
VDTLFEAIDLQMAQLAQALGVGRYRPVEPLLRKFVPKSSHVGFEARAAAIWALAWIHEDSPPPALVRELIVRLNDIDSMPPEDERVRRMCAVAFGRWKSQEAVGSLRRFYTGILSRDYTTNTCGWALEQITGEPLPKSATVTVNQPGWFLEVIE